MTITAELYRAHRALCMQGIISDSGDMSELISLLRQSCNDADMISEMISEPEPVVFDIAPYEYRGYTAGVTGYDAETGEFIGFVREFPLAKCCGSSPEEFLQNFRQEVDLLLDIQSISNCYHGPTTSHPVVAASSTETVVNLLSYSRAR